MLANYLATKTSDVRHRVIPANRNKAVTDDLVYPNVMTSVSTGLSINVQRFNEFWSLMDVLYNHGLVRASTSMIGRTVTSAWWSLVEHENWVDRARKGNKTKLYDFYSGANIDTWDNIKDFYGSAYKFQIAADYLKYFGQAAFYIVRDPLTELPLSLDFLHGMVVPNVDNRGKFKKGEPAFVQYMDRTGTNKEEYDDPRDIVYIVNPDFAGSPLGSSDIAALSEFALPIDIYLQMSAREYLKNRDKPEVIWELPQDISDEAFDAFCTMLEDGYKGPYNIGRNPIAVAGEVNIHELSGMPSSLPYQDSREDVRKEIMAATGLSGYKLGIDSASEGAIKEYRREYSESTIIPLCNTISEALYAQVHIREFGIHDWKLIFNSANFLDGVQQATVHMRYIQNGTLSPNEVRRELGLAPRPGGDVYIDITGEGDLEQNTQGSPPEGREQRPDAPEETGEPSEETGQNDPERGDRGLFLNELRQWRRFIVSRLKKGLSCERSFETVHIDEELSSMISKHIENNYTLEEVRNYFDMLISVVKDYERVEGR